jgi:ABC-2 type transport system permease protein
MHGGKVIWLIDAVKVDFDSLAMGQTLAFPTTVNLEDMLFKYGVRINNNLVQDAQSSRLPINVALAGEAPRFQAEPWIYYPLVTPPTGNVITNNLNKVQLKFASTIDTIEARKNIKKTPLIVSSVNSRTLETPRVVELQEINTPITEIDFNAPNRLMGVLLEGEFESVFANRMLDDYFDAPLTNRLDKSPDNKMVVISDADFIRNEVKRSAQGPQIFPLGFDRLTNQTYGNKELLVNLMSYLTGNGDLLELRGREFKLRLLDRKKVAEELTRWQIINVVLPLFIVAVFGLLFNLVRKKRYSK